MSLDLIPFLLIFLVQIASAYGALRFSTLDPQKPIPRSKAALVTTSLAANLFIVATVIPMFATWHNFFAYMAVALIMTPAIIPPFRLTEAEEPHQLKRLAKSFLGTKSGALFKPILLGLAGIVAWIFAGLFPNAGLPSWFLLIGIAAGFSLLTRTFSFRLANGVVVPPEELPPSFAETILRKRIVAFLCNGLWLSLAMVILENSYSESFEPGAFLLALILAILLSLKD
jgi:hypothetical protein